MAEYLDLDLHGARPEPADVDARLDAAAAAARRSHRGLRIIHGRGEHVLADLAQSWCRAHDLEFAEGVLNPGETRVEALTLQRARGL